MKSFPHIFHIFKNAALAAACVIPLICHAAEPDAEGVKFFEQKIRPVLAERCIKCHGAEKQKGQLRLDTLEASLKGGETRAAIVPGDPAKSLLIAAINHTDPDLTMPPKEPKLQDSDRAAFAEWIKMGAPWPANATIAAASIAKKHKQITDADRAFWSNQPIKNPPVPAVHDNGWAKNEVDKFVFEKLAAAGLDPAPEADRRTLIRRATLDLHGLPPAPEEVDAFVADAAPDAYEKLIERLLASPRYGERAARQWLDLVRYAESDGFKQDAYRATAWPYRDYVIRSMNEDKPYDRFIAEQLAGDEMDPQNPDMYIGTAFLRLSCYEYNQRDVPKAWGQYLDDVTDVCGDVFLGLSMSCAHCHDHKFDPILQKDYYRLQAYFSGVHWRDDLPVAHKKELAEYNAAHEKWAAKTQSLRDQIAAIEQPHLDRAKHDAMAKFNPEFKTLAEKSRAEMTTLETQWAELTFRQIVDERKTIDGKIKGAERERWSELKKKLAEFDAEKPKPLQTTLLVADVSAKAAPVTIPGDATKAEIEPGCLTLLDPKPAVIPAPKTPNTTGRRSALAAWLASPQNPYTARVMVNRLWQYRFGRGIVATTSDFGNLGERPTHPELLDWLATRFVQDGWSLKKINRMLLLSATYRQASTRPMPEVAKMKDPENRLLWRINARRLDAQQIRDSMLMVAGELDAKNGGPSADFSSPSRGIYTKVLRNTHDGLLEVFDEPDGLLTNPQRNVTTTATQALLMINGQFPLQRSASFAKRVKQASSGDPGALADAAYRLAFGRLPKTAERERAAAFLSQTRGNVAPNTHARASSQTYVAQTMPQRGGQAALFRENHHEDILKLADNSALPSGDFTVEAVVLLESIGENADVRTIVSHWDGDQAHAGWSFGVTSEKSKYQPRNLILQLCTGDKKNAGYEVVASDLRIELHKTYYVAACVKLSDTGETGVTFYLRDLTDMDSIMRTAHVKHKLTAHGPANCALVIGGRDAAHMMGWHGLIDEVRLSNAPLSKEHLFVVDGENKSAASGHWKFEENPGFFVDSDKLHTDLHPAAPAQSGGDASRASAPLVDFCHVLFNSNEFLYAE